MVVRLRDVSEGGKNSILIVVRGRHAGIQIVLVPNLCSLSNRRWRIGGSGPVSLAAAVSLGTSPTAWFSRRAEDAADERNRMLVGGGDAGNVSPHVVDGRGRRTCGDRGRG